MKAGKETDPPAAPRESKRSSRAKLLWFAMVVMGIAAFALVSGWLNRDRMRALGGPVHIEVRNASEERYRADVYVGPQFATLEMDPGEHGMVRFNPKQPEPAILKIFQEGNPIKTLSHGTYHPGENTLLRFLIMDDGEIRIEEPGKPGSGS